MNSWVFDQDQLIRALAVWQKDLRSKGVHPDRAVTAVMTVRTFLDAAAADKLRVAPAADVPVVDRGVGG